MFSAPAIMDLDSAIQRYLANPDVARWLFSTDDINVVTAKALDSAFVYAIGFGRQVPDKPRTMHIEDMLVLTGVSGTFLLGFIWGLNQPHVFARTPLMLDKRPVARRFAIDISTQDALEFMEFVSFDDGKTIVMFRQFLHTHDQSLPVVACARLHAASQIAHTLGPIIMRADLFEAASCPVCGQTGRQCLCAFDSYAPNTLVRKSTFNWNQFSSRFMNKARSGTIKLRMTAILPGVGEMCIVDDEIPAINILQKGSTDYMMLLRRKAVHGLGVNVLMPRTDAQVLERSAESDFLDLHNSYVSRKRVRDPQEQATELLHQVDSIELPGPLLDIPAGTPAQITAFGVNMIPSPTIRDDEFGLFTEGRSTKDSQTAISPSVLRQIDSLAAPIEEVECDISETNAFVRQSSDSLMESMFDPNAVATPPSMTAIRADMAALQADIFRDIELILSPEQASGVQHKPEQHVPPTEQLTTATSPPAVHWTSSISSEDSATYHPPRKQTNAKRAKRARVPANEGALSPQTSSETTSETEKKHLCKKCPSRFKMRGDLLRHVKTVHEGKKMYTCKTCGKSFGHSGHLNRHISSVHLHLRRFKCQFCGFPFFQASHLQSHIGHIHSAKKPYECNFCGVRVNTESALKAHMEKAKCSEAIAKETFACSFHGCSSKFSTHIDLEAHKALVHQALTRVLAPGSRYHALLS